MTAWLSIDSVESFPGHNHTKRQKLLGNSVFFCFDFSGNGNEEINHILPFGCVWAKFYPKVVWRYTVGMSYTKMMQKKHFLYYSTYRKMNDKTWNLHGPCKYRTHRSQSLNLDISEQQPFCYTHIQFTYMLHIRLIISSLFEYMQVVMILYMYHIYLHPLVITCHGDSHFHCTAGSISWHIHNI